MTRRRKTRESACYEIEASSLPNSSVISLLRFSASVSNCAVSALSYPLIFSGGENTTAGWHSGAASLVLRVLKREFGASNCQKEVAPCSMRDLGAVRSPHMRAKKPGNQAVLKMRGFLRLGTEAINDVVPIKVMDFLFAKQMCLR